MGLPVIPERVCRLTAQGDAGASDSFTKVATVVWASSHSLLVCHSLYPGENSKAERLINPDDGV